MKTPKPTEADPSDRLAALAVAALEALKAIDVRVLDVHRLTPLTDYMVICTGTSSRHVKSMADKVLEQARQHGTPARGVEGLSEGEWVLVDLGAVVVHVMQAQARAFYQLEKLWDLSETEARARAS
ncbi:MAG: ribosome silencing factor [Sinobacteraceae bacterium]|nr:ribosome silencing factor [Nevskia sp.]MDI3260609.1 ribosome silencing factor [Nevskiaceae bacterium]